MKTVLILSILLIQSISLCQVVHHFANSDSRWNVAESYPGGNLNNPNFIATTTSVFGIQGDSLISGDTWRKMYVTSDSLFLTNLEFVGVTRVENDRVLFRDTLNQLDTLYDFSLEVGDSVLYNINGNYLEWIDILDVDSVLINGSHYKRFYFDEPSMSAFDWLNEVWIEGIGSIHGPLFPRYPRKFSGEMPDSMLLTCSFSSGQDVWNNSDYDDCYVNDVLGLKMYSQNSFSVYPNPFSTEIYVESTNSGIEQIIIYVQLGKVVLKIDDYTEGERIDMSTFDSGLYLLKIKADQSSTIKRIIKN
jgi:hypothetical protein